MVVLGLLLVLAAGALTAAVVMVNTDAVAVSAFGESLSGLTIGGLFLAGVVVGAIAILGLTMMLAGLSRGRARRATRRQEIREVRDERETLAEENARLREELSASRDALPAYADNTVYPEDTIGRHSETDSDRPSLFRR